MTTKSPVQVAAMQVLITVKFSADPAMAQKLANKMYDVLRKAGVSADVTLAFEGVRPNSAVGGASTGQ